MRLRVPAGTARLEGLQVAVSSDSTATTVSLVRAEGSMIGESGTATITKADHAGVTIRLEEIRLRGISDEQWHGGRQRRAVVDARFDAQRRVLCNARFVADPPVAKNGAHFIGKKLLGSVRRVRA